MTRQRGSDLRVLLLVGAVVLIAWAFVVPILESPDEHLHWQYARYVHDQWRLPVYRPDFAEANSPPLYYAAVAPVATRTVLPPPLIWMDGLDELAHPLGARLHVTAADDFQHYWPIRVARLMSAAMALATAWLCGLAARTLTGRASTAVLAAGFALFLPQFSYRGTSVSNDVLVTAMSAWLLWMLARWIRDGYSPRVGALTAIALAGAYLSKISAICLVPAVVVVILTEPVRWRARAAHLWVLVAAVLIVLPWSWRNVVLYGDPFASGAMHHAVGTLMLAQPLSDLNQHFVILPRELFKSFVGWFGYFTVKLPKWAYAPYLVFMLFATAGLVRAIVAARREPDVRRRWARVALLWLATVVANFAVVVRINLDFPQPQGRYMFPALPAIVVAMAIGLEAWRPQLGDAARAAVRASRWTIAAWGAANLAILWWIVVPAYYPPLVASVSRVSTPVSVTAISGIVPDGAGDGAYVLDGAKPELTSDVRIDANDARFVMFDLDANLPTPTATGEAVVMLDQPGPGDLIEYRLPFEWRPDGKRRKIYLTSLTQPDWQGVVVQVRILPLREAGETLRGRRLRLGGIVVAGSIPTNDY